MCFSAGGDGYREETGLCGGGMAILSGSMAASGETSRLAGSSLEMDLGDGGRPPPVGGGLAGAGAGAGACTRVGSPRALSWG